MSEFEQKPNTGALFKNDKKENENHPNAKGSILVDGKEYWISAWTNTDKSGNKYQKLSVKLKDEQAAPSTPPAPPADDFDDDLPF